MVEFFKKNQKNITIGAAVTLLVICYFQQKELARLRKETQVIKEIQINNKSIDSLSKKLNIK